MFVFVFLFSHLYAVYALNCLFWPSTHIPSFFPCRPWFFAFSLFSLFCVYVDVCACTCLCCVKMNLVISTSKMTNCHDGLLSTWYWRREKKSCSYSSCSSSFFHKQLPINVTFHLYTLVLTRQTIFNDIVLMTRWYFDLSPCLSYFLLCIYLYMSFCRIQISLVDPVTQWDKCHLSLFYKKHEWKKRKRKKEKKASNFFILPYRCFSFLYHITNHCIVSSNSRNNYCSMLFYLFVSDWPMVNYCKCEPER